MTTRSVGRPAFTSRGGGTGGRAGSGGGRTRGHSGNQDDGRIDGRGGQVGGQGSEVNDDDQGRCQGNGRNQNDDAVNDNIRVDVSRGCAYKEFLACNTKEYDGKGGAIVYTRWIERMESIHDMSRCRDSQRVKYTTSSFVVKALTWCNSKIRTQGQEATVGISWEDFRTLTREEFFSCNEIQKFKTELWSHAMVRTGHAAYNNRFHELARLVPHLVTPKGMKMRAGTLTDEAFRNGSIKKNLEKKGNRGEPSKDRNGTQDNKRTRTGNAFDTTTNPVRGGYTGSKARGNQQKQFVTINEGQGHGNQGNQARGRAFMLGAEEARQDLNTMMGTFTLNDHYVTTLFDSVADYSFVSTTFIPLLDIKPSELGFSYEIEIASGSFDVIMGMDWLSDHKAMIIFHEKVVKIPLLDGKVLTVLGEKPKEKMRQLMSDKANKMCCSHLVSE
uniref:Reverse transcriptase domain-containing protein n=1 Tax=Tanacetum cinerariifolium TaxID=118510 RepID=A0A6L2L558_TANCI|nr:reverse transcriptase domain-containing protein [Tanacetum cinerariifolium]